MGRYIDADALDRAFSKLRFNNDGELEHYGDRPNWYLWGSEVENLIADAPHIDIVRCKECKEWDKNDHECYLDRGGLYFPNAYDFCSYGERKDKCKECWYWSEVHKRCENKCGCQFKPYEEREA